MLESKQQLHRRGFLATLAAGAATLGLTTFAGPLRAGAAPGVHVKDQGNPTFEAWLNRIQGKHKQVYDAPDANGGMPLVWSRVFLMTNGGLGIPENELTVVVVLRHDAIPLAMEDGLWSKYKFGEVFHITDGATTKASLRNPYWNPKEGELPLPGMSIGELQKSGVLFAVCDMALTVYSGIVAKGSNLDGAEVKKEWVAGLLPGIEVVPSGVLAINRAQERGCTYCFAG